MPIELPHVLGVALAIAAAICFAVQFLCIRVGTVQGGVLQAVFISLLTNVILVCPLVLLVHGMPAMTPTAVLWFGLAGISGSLIARTCMFKSVQIIGASRTSPVISANVFFASLLAIVLFGESVTILHAIGIAVIVVGVGVISWETAQDANPGQSLRDVGISLLLPLLAALFIAFEPIFVSLGLAEGSGVLPGVAVKVLAAWIGFAGYVVAVGSLSEMFTQSRETAWFLAAGATSAIGIIAYFSALEAAPVVIVVPLITTSPLIVVLLSYVFLPQRLERITWRLVVAATVVVLGASFVGVQ